MRYLNSGETFVAHCDLCSSPYASHDIDSGLYCQACAEEILAERRADSFQPPGPRDRAARRTFVLLCGLSAVISLTTLGFILTSIWGLIYGAPAP